MPVAVTRPGQRHRDAGVQNGGMTLTAAPGYEQQRGPIRRFRVTSGLKWLTAFGGFGVSVSALYATTGIGFPCPLRTITGWDCPLCGGTRLGESLLHGHISDAFGYNPAVFILLVVLVGIGALWLIEAVGGPAVRPPRRLSARLRGISPKVWGIIIAVVAVGDTLARNLL